VSRIEDLVRRHALGLLVAAFIVVALAELLLRRDAADAPQTTLWLVVPAVVLLGLPALVRHGHPFAAGASFWLLAAALSFVDGRLVTFPIGVFFLGMTASFLLGDLRDGRTALIGLAIVIGAAIVIVANQPSHDNGSFVFVPVLFAISWLAGFALRGREHRAEEAEARAAQAERERDAAARLAVAEERGRIARELHDVVAHAVSVMVLQTGAVRHKLPEELCDEADALRSVERTGRTALAEMRRLLGAMRRDDDDLELGPQPGLANLDALVDQVGRAGLPVVLNVEGERVVLPPAVDLSAFRIVQEGLTNALKHARATRADVTLAYTPGEVRIEVRDDGVAHARSDGLGHGLVGVRERVKIFGGDMSAGPGESGGFVLSANLPIESAAR